MPWNASDKTKTAAFAGLDRRMLELKNRFTTLAERSQTADIKRRVILDCARDAERLSTDILAVIQLGDAAVDFVNREYPNPPADPIGALVEVKTAADELRDSINAQIADGAELSEKIGIEEVARVFRPNQLDEFRTFIARFAATIV